MPRGSLSGCGCCLHGPHAARQSVPHPRRPVHRRGQQTSARLRRKSAQQVRGSRPRPPLVRRAATGCGIRGPAAQRRCCGRGCAARPPLAQCGCARFLPCGPEASRRRFRGQRRDFPCAASSAAGAAGPMRADFTAIVGIFHGQRAWTQAVGGIPRLRHQRVFARHPWITLFRRMGLSCPDRRPSRSRGWKHSDGGRRTGSPWRESVPRGTMSSLQGTEAGSSSWQAPKALASAAPLPLQPGPARPPGQGGRGPAASSGTAGPNLHRIPAGPGSCGRCFILGPCTAWTGPRQAAGGDPPDGTA